MSDPKAVPQGSVVTVEFVRHRNALLVRAELGELFTDLYLHLADQGLRHPEALDRFFKDALAAFTLFCASRPRPEHLAWTLGLQAPRANVFLAGDNEDDTVAGRIFTENVREAERNVFYCDVVPRRGAETRRSVVTFDGTDALQAAQTFHADSEQRPARYFHLGGDEYALLVAHPDCDLAWYRSIGQPEIRTLASRETLALIERRDYRWECGCNQRRIMRALAPAARQDMGDLFGEAESIRVQCPRCAAVHVVTREAMEAFLADPPKAGA